LVGYSGLFTAELVLAATHSQKDLRITIEKVTFFLQGRILHIRLTRHRWP
jgi:hypothetical protein